MEYLFRPNPNGIHVRLVDGVRGTLKTISEAVKVQPITALVDPEDFALYHNPLSTTENETIPLTQSECIVLGKQHVQNAGYGADEKVICLNKLLKIKEQNTIASYPKLVEVYEWLETVQAMAVAGQTAFPSAPHTFEVVVAE